MRYYIREGKIKSDGVKGIPKTPRPNISVQSQYKQGKLEDACMWYRHDFFGLDKEEREKILFQAKEWILAFEKAGIL